MALLLTREKRESWTGLVSGLSAYYQSPGRLAVLRRRFESAFRRPGLDPATFATELGILAIQSSTDPGGGFRRNKHRKSNWRIPTENGKRDHWRPIVRSFRPWKYNRGRPEIRRDQPISVPPKWAGDRRALRRRSPGIWTMGCGRLKTFSRSLRRTAILGHGESRRP